MEYRDMTFCPYYQECDNQQWNKNLLCVRALTPQVKERAKKSGLPICRFEGHPKCFERIEGRSN